MSDATAHLPSRRFDPRVYGVGAWTPHLHFGYDVAALLRPRTIVELGVDRGESYFAFCQAIAENNISARCFGIDTWQGDAHAGEYDETTFDEVSSHHAANYAAFSTLLRMTFDDARAQFADGSIDLLHIDGLHTEAAVRHDVYSWLPKLCAGGILLLHDVNVRSRGFGVWKVWDELQQRGRGWTFDIGPGLALWQKTPEMQLPQPLESLVDAPNDSAQRVETYYRARAAEIDARIAQHWRDGSIRNTPFANQTIIQVFYTNGATHREEDSVYARTGHEKWRDISVPLPAFSGPLRIDFVSAFHVIEIGEITINYFNGIRAIPLADVALRGDAVRLESPGVLALKVTGIDPQLHLPSVDCSTASDGCSLEMRLRVIPET